MINLDLTLCSISVLIDEGDNCGGTGIGSLQTKLNSCIANIKYDALSVSQIYLVLGTVVFVQTKVTCRYTGGIFHILIDAIDEDYAIDDHGLIDIGSCRIVCRAVFSVQQEVTDTFKIRAHFRAVLANDRIIHIIRTHGIVDLDAIQIEGGTFFRLSGDKNRYSVGIVVTIVPNGRNVIVTILIIVGFCQCVNDQVLALAFTVCDLCYNRASGHVGTAVNIKAGSGKGKACFCAVCIGGSNGTIGISGVIAQAGIVFDPTAMDGVVDSLLVGAFRCCCCPLTGIYDTNSTGLGGAVCAGGQEGIFIVDVICGHNIDLSPSVIAGGYAFRGRSPNAENIVIVVAIPLHGCGSIAAAICKAVFHLHTGNSVSKLVHTVHVNVGNGTGYIFSQNNFLCIVQNVGSGRQLCLGNREQRSGVCIVSTCVNTGNSAVGIDQSIGDSIICCLNAGDGNNQLFAFLCRTEIIFINFSAIFEKFRAVIEASNCDVVARNRSS